MHVTFEREKQNIQVGNSVPWTKRRVRHLRSEVRLQEHGNKRSSKSRRPSYDLNKAVTRLYNSRDQNRKAGRNTKWNTGPVQVPGVYNVIFFRPALGFTRVPADPAAKTVFKQTFTT